MYSMTIGAPFSGCDGGAACLSSQFFPIDVGVRWDVTTCRGGRCVVAEDAKQRRIRR
jgi:hypothetical protein